MNPTPPDFELHKKARKTLKDIGDLKHAVICEDQEHLDEWLAVHTVDFFNHINILYGSISEFCTPQTCPLMSAGNNFEYLWAEAGQRKPVKLCANEYIEKLFTWIQGLIDDENTFPVQPDAPFPPSFQDVVKTILKRLFRVYAHIYYHHFDKVQALGEEPHLNTCFQHFFYFVDEHKLVARVDMAPLEPLINTLCNPAAKSVKKK